MGAGTGTAGTSFPRRIAQLAGERDEHVAIHFVPLSGQTTSLSWRSLDRESNRMARLLAYRGAGEGSMVAIALPNCLDHLLVTLAAWKVGACAPPLSPGPAAPRAAAVPAGA